jgi:hypothetical protein
MVGAPRAGDRDADPSRSGDDPPVVLGIDAVIVVAAGLVLLRSVVYLRFEQLGFDSDQAIVGLMAKHLVEGRAFPLFFYGQTYLLGVESWAAAPLFAIAGPTVLALRLSILAWNIAAAVVLVKGLKHGAALPGWAALVPVLFFVAAPPSIAELLMTAHGGIIEPFVYVAALWFLRDRPLVFGAVLAVGTLNREFTFYAVPALLLVQLLGGKLSVAGLRHWLLVMVAFLIVWESVEGLKPYADLMGPGTRGQLIDGYSGSQVSNLVGRFDWNSGELLQRVTNLGAGLIAWFAGAAQVDGGLPLPARAWLGWAAGIGLLLATLRTVWLLLELSSSGRVSPGPSYRQRLLRQIARVEFAVYLLGVGAAAVVVFISAKPTLIFYARYALLGLLAPLGLTATWLSLEPRRPARLAIVVVVVAWAALMVVDHAKVLLAYEREPPLNPERQLADYFLAHGIDTAAGRYWRAYEVTFLTGERVRVASLDYVRIEEYQRLLAEHPNAVRIEQGPCPAGERVGDVWVCRP